MTVTKKDPILITPSGPTPSGNLPLSFLDRAPGLRYFGEVISVFKHGHGAAQVIREAVAEALVLYYPVAGRIVADPDDGGRMRVSCSGEGVWFVEASADCSLEDVGFLESQPFLIPEEQLLPCPPPGVDHDAVPFMIQVTEFMSGGFTFGLKGNHVIFDGTGAAQFTIAIGELARAVNQPTVTPVWQREKIPTPSNIPYGIQLTQSTTLLTAYDIEHYTVDITSDIINRLREQLLEGVTCSVFDIVAAKLWQCRTRAINLPPDANVSLTFPANCRNQLKEELTSEGFYYGNCTFPIAIDAVGSQIANASLSELVMSILKAKERLSSEFWSVLKGGSYENPERLILTYRTTNLTDMRHVGFAKADYGWGIPSHVVPLIDNGSGVCFIVNPPAPKRGVRIMTHCVAKEHLSAFCDEMKKIGSM